MVTRSAMIELECDAVLFDLDGVLVDSSECVVRLWRRWAAEHDLDLDEIMRVVHGRPTIETISLVAPHLPAKEEAARFDAAEAIDTDGVTGIEGASQLVHFLPSDAWAVVTSGTRDTAMTRLTYTGLPVPSVLITADDIRRGKPDPEAYLLAAAKLGIAPGRCVVVEDAPVGISAAHSAGMRVVAVETTYSQIELREADVKAKQLTDIRVSWNVKRPGGRLTVGILLS
jgi:sugar-phosphatase